MPHFSGLGGPEALIVYLRTVRCLFEKKNAKFEVKVHTFEIPNKNVVINSIYSIMKAFDILFPHFDVVIIRRRLYTITPSFKLSSLV